MDTDVNVPRFFLWVDFIEGVHLQATLRLRTRITLLTIAISTNPLPFVQPCRLEKNVGPVQQERQRANKAL